MGEKRVSFGSNSEHHPTAFKDDEANRFYTKHELLHMWQGTVRAREAVDSTCGDFDNVDYVEARIIAVLKVQVMGSSEEYLSEVSSNISSAGVKMARLSAILLEKEVQDSRSVTIDSITKIINEVMNTDDSLDNYVCNVENLGYGDDWDDGESSIGTIETIDWPCEHEQESNDDNFVESKSRLTILDDHDIHCQDPIFFPELKMPDEKENNQVSSCFNRGDRKRMREEVLYQHRQCRQKYSSQVQNCCNVAQAMIWLARWEFRSHRLFRLWD